MTTQRPHAASVAAGGSSRGRIRNADGERIASRGKREFFAFPAWSRMSNPDPTLLKFGMGRDGIGIYTLIQKQFPFVGGYCSQWIDHVLVTDRVIKPAEVDDEALQEQANVAAARAQKAWGRVRNRVIVLQKLLTGRFYGFARAEKVWRFDPVIKEWIEDLYDVPQEAWRFDADGRDYLATKGSPFGIEVDSAKFIHFQWGSADTKYGAGDLSDVYLTLWKYRQIEEFGIQAVEDYSKLIAIVHIPRGFDKAARKQTIESIAEQYRYYVVVPTDEPKVIVETPTINVTSQGAAGRQEYEVLRFYERWIQIRLLGAPQTQDKGGSGNGKLDEIRKDIWEDKTPFGSSALDQCLTEQWLDSYCDVNMPDLPMELRPRFESDTTEVTEGLSAASGQEVRNSLLDLAANRITREAAEEIIVAVGIPRGRAKRAVDSTVKQRGKLALVESTTKPPAPAPADQTVLPEAA